MLPRATSGMGRHLLLLVDFSYGLVVFSFGRNWFSPGCCKGTCVKFEPRDEHSLGTGSDIAIK